MNYELRISRSETGMTIEVTNWGNREIKDGNGFDNNGKGPIPRTTKVRHPAPEGAMDMISKRIMEEERRGE